MNQGMVVAPQPEAVEAGVLILPEGMNGLPLKTYVRIKSR